jgi:hypothetical protein
MTTEPEVPMRATVLSAEELTKLWKRIDYMATSDAEHGTTWIDLDIWQRVRVTIAAKDAEIAELRGTRFIINQAPPMIAEIRELVEDLRRQITEYQLVAYEANGQLRDANRRASDLFDELGVTQNAALAGRVELEAKLREATARADHERGCAQHYCLTCGEPDHATKLGVLPYHHPVGYAHSFRGQSCNCRVRDAALQSAQKENVPK